MLQPWKLKPGFINRVLVAVIFDRPRNAFRNSVFGASKLASAKTPLLNPYCRLHGSNLVVRNFYAEELFYALLRSITLFCELVTCVCALLRSLALFLLRSFACFCERPRSARPRLGTADIISMAMSADLGGTKIASQNRSDY